MVKDELITSECVFMCLFIQKFIYHPLEVTTVLRSAPVLYVVMSLCVCLVICIAPVWLPSSVVTSCYITEVMLSVCSIRRHEPVGKNG